MKFNKAASFLLLLAGFSSCEKVIHLDLHNAAPQYVIEGTITDQAGPYTIRISQSKNFNDNNDFPGISKASVIVNDVSNNISDTLTETSPGLYSTSRITGIPGHTYHLSVRIAGKTFTASSSMPEPVSIDSIYTAIMPDLGKTHISVVPVFTDPKARGNNYHLVQYVNDTISKDVFVFADDFLNGTRIAIPFTSTQEIHAGDKLVVCLQCVDAAMFNYYQCIAINEGVATPSNPVSNIAGGSLGYFSACTISMSKTISAK